MGIEGLLDLLILVQGFQTHSSALIYHTFGVQDLGFGTEANDPA